MVAVPPAPVPFALTPGQASNVVIDYNSSKGIKLYKLATDPLYSKDEDYFDCSSSELKDFLELMEIRAFKYAWDNSVLGIPKEPLVVNIPVQRLLKLHGLISIETIREHVDTYIATHTRAAQDSMQLYECLVRSITKEGRDKVTIWKQDYMVGTPALPSGVLLLKVIIRESHIDTHATTSHIRPSLASLDEYLPTIGSDIVKFNIYVKELVKQLKARGEVTHELLTFLFKGYKAAQDKVFVKYIEKKEEEYEEGEDMLPHILINQAANKFKMRKLKGIWMAQHQKMNRSSH
jgi:S-adenosylmethionine/arginine decarboxylase-like enzyme